MNTTPLKEWERRMADRLAARDSGALAELHDRFAPFVHALAARVSRDRSAADDVTQEVFLALWQKPGRFDPARGSLRAWLATVTHHTAVGWVRKQVAMRRREAGSGALAESVDDVEETVLRHVDAEDTRRAVADLPDVQREAVALAYFDNLTYRQVAFRTGVAEGTAKSRLRLALLALAGNLQTN